MLEFLGLGGDFTVHSVDVGFLGDHVSFEVGLIGFFFSGELGEGVNEVLSNVVHEVTDLSDGITVGELGS